MFKMLAFCPSAYVRTRPVHEGPFAQALKRRTPSLTRTLSAARDEHGVPHISASSWRDALYGLGYMHGLDRPTQMLFARAIASHILVAP